MSPLDEIRYINKLAATRGKKNLSRYHRWVLGGCRGPNPVIRGGCRKTKITAAEAIELTLENKKLRATIRLLRREIKALREG